MRENIKCPKGIPSSTPERLEIFDSTPPKLRRVYGLVSKNCMFRSPLRTHQNLLIQEYTLKNNPDPLKKMTKGSWEVSGVITKVTSYVYG